MRPAAVRLSGLLPALFWGPALALLLLPTGARAAGDADKGKEIARQHCTRCHVVGDLNKYGGIDSTPSFGLLVGLDDWRERFSTFYALRPHPVFVRMPDLPPPTEDPPHVATFEITPEQVDDLVAFAETMREGGD